jgi:hypothetical protein
MRRITSTLLLSGVWIFLSAGAGRGQPAPDTELLPPQLPRDQRENLLRFLQKHDQPDRFVPQGAKIVSSQAGNGGLNEDSAAGKPVKQYTVQIIPHRPVPGETNSGQVDVYYYRPHPEKGKPGITVKHTVDLTTGKEVGQTEVLLNSHTPLAREELAEAVALAKEKSPAVQELYKDRDKNGIHWEYLQLMVNRKSESQEPGDRVLRLVFSAKDPDDRTAQPPIRVIVNLTKGSVLDDKR